MLPILRTGQRVGALIGETFLGRNEGHHGILNGAHECVTFRAAGAGDRLFPLTSRGLAHGLGMPGEKLLGGAGNGVDLRHLPWVVGHAAL